MATVTHQRHKGGRPRTAERSPVFHLIDGLRARRGLTILEVAGAAGICRDTIYTLRDPRVSTVRKLAAALGMPVSKLAASVAKVESESSPE